MPNHRPIQAISCCITGTAFSVEYVDKLYRSLKRNTSKPFTFFVICDGQNYVKLLNNKEYHCIVPSQTLPGWWIKTALWGREWIDGLTAAGYTHNLYFDLDTVITSNIDDLFYRPEPFSVLRNFLQPPVRNPNVYPAKFGSAVMSFNYAPSVVFPDMKNKFLLDKQDVMQKYDRTGDQVFFEDELERLSFPVTYLQDIFPENANYFRSVKYPTTIDSLNKLPWNTHVLCYHGDRRMHLELDTDLVKNFWC